ncbi:MAG: hypothetical protein D6736_12300 [Nitrospinota bacterium]|nr:MAG: hypothetical protein D6736_12300 [Nitrospinota bacterium]
MKAGSEMREAVVRTLLSLLHRDNELSRCCAARALGEMKAQEAVPALITRLQTDPDPDVRMEAAAALGKLGSAESLGALIDALHSDPDGDVRIQCCLALKHSKSPRVLETLLPLLYGEATAGMNEWGDDEDMEFSAAWELQEQALEALEDSGDARAARAVITLLESDDYPDLQERGFRLLARQGGKEGTAFLLRQLQEGERLTRRRAAQALAWIKAPEARQALLRALQDPDPAVRIAAARSLGEQADDQVLVPLLRLLQDPEAEVRREVAAVVARWEHPVVLNALLSLLHDTHPSVRQQGVFWLGERGEAGAVEPLLRLLEQQSEDTLLCSEAIKALGKIRAPAAVIPLCRILQDRERDAEIRMQAALALGDLVKTDMAVAEREEEQVEEGPSPLDPLEVLVEAVADTEVNVCFAALLSLTRIGGARASETFVKAIRGEIPAASPPSTMPQTSEPAPADAGTESQDTLPGEDPQSSTLAAIEARYQAEMSAASPPPPDHALLEQQRRVQRHAARLARELGDPAVLESLRQAAAIDDPELQREALLSLATLDDPQIREVALPKLHAPHREVRIAALDALERYQAPEAVDALITLLDREEDPLVIQRAVEVLGTWGDARAGEAILPRLNHESRPVRCAALEALAALNSSEAIPHLRPLLFAQGGDLRKEVASALKKLGDTELTPFLLRILQDPAEEEKHWMAIEALAELFRV